MNFIVPRAETLIRDIPLSRLALAPENVRKTPPDPRADAELKASIAALGLLENLIVRTDENGVERYAVVAGGRRLKAMQALVEDEVFDADHPVPCLVRAGDDGMDASPRRHRDVPRWCRIQPPEGGGVRGTG